MTEIYKENDELFQELPPNLEEPTTSFTPKPQPPLFLPQTDPTASERTMEMRLDDPALNYPSSFFNPIPPMDKATTTIFMDHCYSRPWNWRPESSFLKPTKTLFISKPQVKKKKSTNPLAPIQDCSETIDVEAVPVENPPVYDEVKARYLMGECERHASLARVDQGNEDWEEGISKVNWSPVQNRLFNGMVHILNSDHLARLTHAGASNEPVLRRAVVDKSVKRMRRLMACISWDAKLTQWLHQLLVDNLSTQYLAAYLDILQTLRSKLPTFVEKMMYGPGATRLGVLGVESLFPLLKRPWDPVAASLQQDKPKKLPGNSVIVVIPPAPTTTNPNQFKRVNKWISLLSSLAPVVTVPTNIEPTPPISGATGQRMTMTNCLDQMLAATRCKIQEIRSDCSVRNIILAGFNASASLALQVAQAEPVLCVVCLGFSLLTADGKRGDPDDNLLELQCPVLFVIGQCSNTSLQEDMEDLRERMRVETGLIVVGSADDYLRINKKKKKSEGITQSVVDRCIVDEVGEFVSGILLSPCPPQLRQSPTHTSNESGLIKRSKTERKRQNSNGSSIDSEPPSPTPRIPRPVGRPPGSKSRTKLEAKWAAQVAQGTKQQQQPTQQNQLAPSPSPSSSPPPPPLTPTAHDTSSTDSVPSLLLDQTPHDGQAQQQSTSPVDTETTPPSKGKGARGRGSARQSPGAGTPTTGSTLSHLLQGNYKSSSGKQSSGMKVLENITLNPSQNTKLVSSNTGRPIDLSKITVLNPVNSTKVSGSLGNVLLMPDGKIKAITSSTKAPGVTKYITSKKQLLGTKPPKPMKKMPFAQPPLQTTLPPPTNLTSQDIMDLPIIFADDNQMLTNTTIQQPPDIPKPNQMPQTFKLSTPTSTGKIVLVNKHHVPFQGTAGNIILSQSGLKRPAGNVPFRSQTNPMKYSKIIISSKHVPEEAKGANSNIMSKISALSPEISFKKVENPLEAVDLENELVATAVPKPNFSKDVKNVTIITKKPEGGKSDGFSKPLQTIINEALAKRNAAMAEIGIDDETDPDYIPPKSVKLDGG